jgi:hypothetical protein
MQIAITNTDIIIIIIIIKINTVLSSHILAARSHQNTQTPQISAHSLNPLCALMKACNSWPGEWLIVQSEVY